MKLPNLAKSEANGIILLAILLLSALSAFNALNWNVVKTSAVESPYIGVIPATTVNQSITPGMNYTVSIYTDYNGSDVWGYEFKLAYNPDVLEGVEVVNGDLITGGTAVFIPGEFNNTAGELRLTGAFFFFTGDPPMTSGPGILANVTFNVVDLGESAITLETNLDDPDRTKLIGYYYNTTESEWVQFKIIDSGTMPDHIQHGFFGNAPDIAVTDVTPSVLEAKPGTMIDIDVAVVNNGTVGEEFNVTVYYDSNEIDTTLVSLGAGANTTVSVVWNTTSATEGDYTISAYARPVPGEVDTTDNTFVNGEVRITSIIHDVAVINVTPSANVVLAGESVNITTTVKNKGTETETFSVTTYYGDNTIETKPVTDLAPDAEEVITFTWNTTGVAGGNYTIKAMAELPGEVNVADNTFVDGDVRVEVHDVAVTSITVSPETGEIGENITITVVVQNEGTETETFEVKVYRDATEIGAEDVTSLGAGAQSTLTFIWATADLDAGDYVIEAVADEITGETDVADNTKTYGTVTLSTPSPEGLPMEIVIAGILVAIAILALVSYILWKRRKPSQG